MPNENVNNPAPAPVEKKKSGLPVCSVRPKEDFKAFLEALIKEKGSSQSALEHCIRFTMQESGKIADPKPIVIPGPTYVPAEDSVKWLDKIKLKKKLSSWKDAIDYCIRYTTKNDWL